MTAFKGHFSVVRARRVRKGHPPKCRYVAKMSATSTGYAEFGHMPFGYSFWPRFKRHLTRFSVPLHLKPRFPSNCYSDPKPQPGRRSPQRVSESQWFFGCKSRHYVPLIPNTLYRL
jgi:hypothetical protein